MYYKMEEIFYLNKGSYNAEKLERWPTFSNNFLLPELSAQNYKNFWLLFLANNSNSSLQRKIM